MTAAAEVSAAIRSRPERDIQPTDLAFLTSRRQPGWAAVVAVYPERRVPKAVALYEKLGAAIVWNASEEHLADMAQNPAPSDHQGPAPG